MRVDCNHFKGGLRPGGVDLLCQRKFTGGCYNFDRQSNVSYNPGTWQLPMRASMHLGIVYKRKIQESVGAYIALELRIGADSAKIAISIF